MDIFGIFSTEFLHTAVAFVAVLAVVVGALFFSKFVKRNPTFDDILKIAKVAVLAVEKLADNGKYAGLSPEERHKRKKEDAVKFIKNSLKVEFGIKTNAVLDWVIDFAIEAVLKQLDL